MLLPDGDDRIVLPMKKLSFKGILEAVLPFFDMVTVKQWTQAKAKYYLQTEGINTVLAERCLKLPSIVSN